MDLFLKLNFTTMLLPYMTDVTFKIVEKLFSTLDTNKDHKISKKEFLNGLKRFAKKSRDSQLGCDDQSEQQGKRSIDKQRPSEVQASSKVKGSGKNQYIVVRGSPQLNKLSSTDAFRMSLVHQKSLKNIKASFTEMDQNEDGFMDLTDFQKFMDKHCQDVQNMAPSIFSTLDSADIGLISFDQMLKVLYPTASEEELCRMSEMVSRKRSSQEKPSAQFTPQQLEEARLVFQVYDSNGDGTLEEDEFSQGMLSAGFTYEESKKAFHEIDVDKSGVVTLPEYEAWFVQQAKKAQRALQEH